MKRRDSRSLAQITHLEDALAIVDNRIQEWRKILPPFGQFLASASTLLRVGYGVPLDSDMRRYVGAFYAIADERDIRYQVETERDHLNNQREIMLHLEKKIGALIRKIAERTDEWKAYLRDDMFQGRPLTPDLREYYKDMIDYANSSSESLVHALKKVTATIIDSEESLVFNDLQRHSSLVCYMQNRTHLCQQLNHAKEKRLEMERIHRDVIKDMDFLRNRATLDAVHVTSLPLVEREDNDEQ